ncbi:MAG TPA: hypothetical protein VMV69_07570 [Pirellulales bacterium]|nr:hypothetical protein [Pirellulales bacterium]
MATVAHSNKHDQDATPEKSTPAPKRRGGRLMFFAALLVALVALAPTIATRTPLRGACLALACRVAGVNGSVRADDLSLGWLSPISATQVEIDDPQGNPLLNLASLDCDKTLLDLLLRRSELGHIRLGGVKAEVTFSDTGSNFKEVLNAWLQPNTSATRVTCDLEISDAQAAIHDTASKRDWLVEKIALRLTLPADPLPTPGEAPHDWLARCTAKADLGWQTASFHGFLVGQGQIEAQLAEGMIHVTPLDLPVSEGQVHLAPQLRLSPAPAILTHDAGRVVERVVLTPEMCNAGLKFALPFLAGVTEAQGRFSVDLADCKLPLSDLGAGDAAGRITIDSAELGPGLLAREFGPVLETLRQVFKAGAADPLLAVKVARECPVDFRLVNGRIYHRGLVLEFPNITVRTYGSVGLDETLAIMAELTLPEPWTANHPLGAALQAAPLRIPIGGTLKQPRIDSREVQKLAGRAVEDAAQGVIHHELGRELQQGLDHLFGPAR